MNREAHKIDACSIERANWYAKEVVADVLDRAHKYTDKEWNRERMLESECVVCYKRPRGRVCLKSVVATYLERDGK